MKQEKVRIEEERLSSGNTAKEQIAQIALFTKLDTIWDRVPRGVSRRGK